MFGRCDFFVVVGLVVLVGSVSGIGVNWGTQSTHPLSPSKVVKMLKDNGIQKVKLFDADPGILDALKKSGIQVMVGIPNDMLYTLANSVEAAEKWVSKNVSKHVSSGGVDIRFGRLCLATSIKVIMVTCDLCCSNIPLYWNLYVAVGNEPFLSTYNGTYETTTLPALQNIQAALTKSGLSNRVKVTVPLNADVYQSSSEKPSDGIFRPDINSVMLQIVKFLNDNGAPFTVNIYPFISLYADPNFPVDYAFFNGYQPAINDNGRTYDNVFDANHDTLVWALQKNGFGNLPIIVGEIGWPTDGDRNANLQYAQHFNQGFMSRYMSGKGTPMRPSPIDAYLFSLIDEDAKSIQPGNFERHWGMFYLDGKPKYQLNLGSARGNGLVGADGVDQLAKKWCVLKPSANLNDDQVAPSVAYACQNADCTSLGFGTSCGI
ncbi:hypothetical protein ACSQ67_018805 [Phaseolus vulgaris]